MSQEKASGLAHEKVGPLLGQNAHEFKPSGDLHLDVNYSKGEVTVSGDTVDDINPA